MQYSKSRMVVMGTDSKKHQWKFVLSAQPGTLEIARFNVSLLISL